MASIQKRSNGYRAFICVNGIRESQCFRTKKEAVAWAESRSIELRQSKGNPSSGKTFGDALRDYAKKVSPSKRGERWEKIRIEAMLNNPIFPSSVLIDQVSANTLAQWRDERLKSVSPGSVLREINLVSSILETARKEWQWINHNPMRDIRKPKEPDHREVLYTRKQIKALLVAMNHSPTGKVVTIAQSIAVCFLTALRTGMRAGELTGLTWDRVREDYCVLPVTKTVPRNVPLTRKAIRLIEKMRGFDSTLVFGVTAASLDANFRKYRRKAGIEGVTFHDSRHYAATHLSRRIDVLALCRMFGWSNTKQALTYYNEHASDIAKRINAQK